MTMRTVPLMIEQRIVEKDMLQIHGIEWGTSIVDTSDGNMARSKTVDEIV